MSEANNITAGLLDEIPKRFPNVRVWRNNRVKAMAIGKGGKPRMINAGVDGQADISGIARVRISFASVMAGIRVEIEVKAGRDQLNKDQRNFRDMILDHHGIYLTVLSVADGLTALQCALGWYSGA